MTEVQASEMQHFETAWTFCSAVHPAIICAPDVQSTTNHSNRQDSLQDFQGTDTEDLAGLCTKEGCSHNDCDHSFHFMMCKTQLHLSLSTANTVVDEQHTVSTDGSPSASSAGLPTSWVALAPLNTCAASMPQACVNPTSSEKKSAACILRIHVFPVLLQQEDNRAICACAPNRTLQHKTGGVRPRNSDIRDTYLHVQ